MKKWISLLLALTMAGTLAVPAMAVESEDIEIVEDEYVETEYDRGWSEGWDAGYADSAAKALADFLAGVPYTGEAELTYQDGYEDGYADGMTYGYEEAYTAYSEIQDKNGVPGAVNVMWNGTCLSFPEVRPEVKNGRTMIPVRAVMEGMDADVSYDRAKKSVGISMGDTVVTFVIGAQTATISSGGEEKFVIEMDCAPYLKDGSTMVPLSFLADACAYAETGAYDVLWDQVYQTAVVVDRKAWIKDTDENRLSCINKVLQEIADNKSGRKTEETGTVSVTIGVYNYDAESLEDITVTGTMTAWTEGTKAWIEGTLDLSGLGDNLKESGLEIQNLSDLKKIQYTILLDEQGEMYITMPQFADLIGFDKNTWVDLGNLVEYGVNQTISVGKMLADSAMMTVDYAPLDAYENLDLARTELMGILGDDIAVANGDGYTWTIKDGNESGYSGSITLKPDGTGKVDIQMTEEDEEFDMGTSIKMKAVMASQKTEVNIEATSWFFGEVDSKFRVSAQSARKSVDTVPDFNLPEGAVVMPLDVLLYGEIPEEE